MLKVFLYKLKPTILSRNKKILAIDNDLLVLDFVKSNLEREGFLVLTCETSEEGIRMAKQEIPDLILLEIAMPEIDGIEICLQLRALEILRKSALVFYTTKSEDYVQIAGLNAGADDYIIKPVKAKVLLSRVRALLKRHHNLLPLEQDPIIISGAITIDREKYMVFKNDEKIKLPRKEFELLSLLHATPRKVYTRQEIATQIWGHDLGTDNRTIDVHIRKLRKKLGEDFIKTIKGVGYVVGKG